MTTQATLDQTLFYPSPLKEFWQAFAHNKGAVAGLAFMILLVICALFAPWIAPHDPASNTASFCSPHPPGWKVASCNFCWAPMKSAATCCRG